MQASSASWPQFFPALYAQGKKDNERRSIQPFNCFESHLLRYSLCLSMCVCRYTRLLNALLLELFFSRLLNVTLGCANYHRGGANALPSSTSPGDVRRQMTLSAVAEKLNYPFTMRA
jgi:hypothetical protein